MDSAPAPRPGPPAFADARALAALPALCRRFGVRRLDLFGSAATGRFDPDRSDLDFLVSFDASLPPGAYADAWFGLRAALEEMFGRPVDLLTEAALENPCLRRRVEAKGRPLFPAGTPPPGDGSAVRQVSLGRLARRRTGVALHGRKELRRLPRR